MIETLEEILPYISGLWTLPWILIGFIVTVILSRVFDEQKINTLMKKIGLALLYVFVPLLLFRIFLEVDLGEDEIIFSIACLIIFTLMYILSYFFAVLNVKKMKMSKVKKSSYIKTVLANQGRSSAFVGGAILAISKWRVFAALYMSIGGIFLFAVIPYILSYMHKKDIKKSEEHFKIKTLPWYLKVFPWYLLSFAISAIFIHATTGFVVSSFGKVGVIFKFITSLTIPAALYYVGAGIHPHDLKVKEMKKLFIFKKIKTKDHWIWIRSIFSLTVFLTPLLTVLFLGLFLILGFVPNEWFAVIVINSILPITSTNMFLVPYGLDKKVTALSVTWTTIVCVPIVVFLITFFRIYFS